MTVGEMEVMMDAPCSLRHRRNAVGMGPCPRRPRRVGLAGVAALSALLAGLLLGVAIEPRVFLMLPLAALPCASALR